MTLEDKFHSFVKAFSDSECIDELSEHFGTLKRADYLLYERSMIVEVKYLTEDRAVTINEKLNELANSDPGFPQFFGTVPVEEIIKRHSNSDKFRAYICNYAARTLDAVLRTANRQIRDTRSALNLHRSMGIVVLLNEGVQLYDDDFIIQEASRILVKKTASGEYERSDIDAIWFINEYGREQKTVSSVPLLAPAPRNSQMGTFLEMLFMRWASHNGYAMARRRI